MANWKRVVNVADLFDESNGLEFKEILTRVVARLEGLGIEDEDFGNILTALSYAEDRDEFDRYWDDLYDWADEGHRLWIETTSSEVKER